MKATEQCFPVVLFFFILYKVVVTFECQESVTIQMKGTEQYVSKVMFIMLYKVVVTLLLVC